MEPQVDITDIPLETLCMIVEKLTWKDVRSLLIAGILDVRDCIKQIVCEKEGEEINLETSTILQLPRLRIIHPKIITDNTELTYSLLESKIQSFSIELTMVVLSDVSKDMREIQPFIDRIFQNPLYPKRNITLIITNGLPPSIRFEIRQIGKSISVIATQTQGMIGFYPITTTRIFSITEPLFSKLPPLEAVGELTNASGHLYNVPRNYFHIDVQTLFMETRRLDRLEEVYGILINGQPEVFTINPNLRKLFIRTVFDDRFRINNTSIKEATIDVSIGDNDEELDTVTITNNYAQLVEDYNKRRLTYRPIAIIGSANINGEIQAINYKQFRQMVSFNRELDVQKLQHLKLQC